MREHRRYRAWEASRNIYTFTTDTHTQAYWQCCSVFIYHFFSNHTKKVSTRTCVVILMYATFSSRFCFPLCIPPSINWPFFSERLSTAQAAPLSPFLRARSTSLCHHIYPLLPFPFLHTHTYVFLKRLTYCFTCMSVVYMYARVPHVYLVPEAIRC